MSEQEFEGAIATLEQENRQLRARNDRLEAERETWQRLLAESVRLAREDGENALRERVIEALRRRA